MDFTFYNIKLKDGHSIILFLIAAQATLVLSSLFIEIFSGINFVLSTLHFLVMSLYFKFYYKTMKDLNYTFWTLTFFLVIYLLFGIFHSDEGKAMGLLSHASLLSLIMSFTSIYLASSPIYFPKINWWEYDFRYRSDLKVQLQMSEHVLQTGRLTDLRRGCGCIISFDPMKIGDRIKLLPIENYTQNSFDLEVLSQREYSFGRGLHYGVKFVLENDEDKNRYLDLLHQWKENTQSKHLKKYSKLPRSKV